MTYFKPAKTSLAWKGTAGNPNSEPVTFFAPPGH